MSDAVHFDRDETDRLQAIAAEARDALVDRVRAEFSDDKTAKPFVSRWRSWPRQGSSRARSSNSTIWPWRSTRWFPGPATRSPGA